MRRQHLLLAGFAVAALLILTVLVHDYFTQRYPGQNDFMSRWEGARSYVVDGLNPYGAQASLNIQERIYGRPAVEGEDPGYFAYPFYTLFLVWPLVYIPYAWAAAAWMVVLAVCLLAALFLLLDLFGLKPRPWLMALLFLWSLTFYFAARGVLLGQVGHVVYLTEMLAIWGVYKGHDQMAGVALAVSTVKPQMGFLLVPLLLLWALRTRRWRFVIAFAVAFGALMGVSFLMQPSWLGDWIAQVMLYPSYTIGSPVWILTHMVLGLDDAGEWIVTVAIYAAMVWAWSMILLRGRAERFLWAVSITLVVTHLVAPRTATPHFVVFALPLMFYFAELYRRNRRRGGLWIAALLLVLFFFPWVQFVMTIDRNLENPSMFLPLPFVMFALLWLTTQWWWRRAPVPAAVTSSATGRAEAVRVSSGSQPAILD